MSVFSDKIMHYFPHRQIIRKKLFHHSRWTYFINGTKLRINNQKYDSQQIVYFRTLAAGNSTQYGRRK